MLAQRRATLILAVLLLAPIAGAIDNPAVKEENPRDSAAANWHAIEPIQTSHSGLKSLDYQIHL